MLQISYICALLHRLSVAVRQATGLSGFSGFLYSDKNANAGPGMLKSIPTRKAATEATVSVLVYVANSVNSNFMSSFGHWYATVPPRMPQGWGIMSCIRLHDAVLVSQDSF